MASSDTLDFERLLAPISGDSPCGPDVRWEPIYQEIKDARPKSNRDAFGLDEAEDANWNPVISVASDALASTSKDLQIAAWLIEALVHVHGFAGFRDGLKLLNGLLESFWDGLYPLADAGDFEPRAAPLVFLSAKLPDTLRETPLTPDRDEIYSWNYWKARQQLPGEKVEDFEVRAAKVAEKARLFDEAVARMSREATKQLLDDIQQGQEQLILFTKSMDEKLGEWSPNTGDLRTAVDDCLARVRSIFKDKGGDDLAGSTEGPAGDNGRASASASGPIKTREQAFQRLAEVAAYLRQKEPQNPIYLLIDRAVLWSRMPFEKLLEELIKDNATRGQVSELLGIKPPQDSSS